MWSGCLSWITSPGIRVNDRQADESWSGPPEAVPRSPFLWFLIPWAAGIIASQTGGFDQISPLALAVLGVSGLTLSLVLSRFAWAFALFFPPGVLCIALLSVEPTQVDPPDPVWGELPPRETELTLEITDTYRNHGPGRISGIARIRGAPAVVDDLIDRKISVSMPLSGDNPVPLPRGSVVRVEGVLHPIDPESGISFHQYLWGRQVYFVLRRGNPVEIIQSGRWWQRALARANAGMVDTLRLGFAEDDPRSALYRAMLLGDRRALSDEQLHHFRRTGTMHLFAISGLHIGIIAGILFFFLSLVRMDPRMAAAVGLSVLLFYVAVTGMRPSAVRAFTMIAFLWGAKFLWRQYTPFASVMASAAFILILVPSQLFDLGFQLSYGVVSAILLLGLSLGRDWSESWRRNHYPVQLPNRGPLNSDALRFKIVRAVYFSLGISTVSFLASLPLTAVVFGVVPVSGILLNIALVPMASVVLLLGVLSLFFGGLWGLGVVSLALNWMAGWVLAWMGLMVQGVVSAPLHGLSYSGPPAWFGSAGMGIVFLGLLFGRMKQRPSIQVLAAVVLGCLVFLGVGLGVWRGGIGAD